MNFMRKNWYYVGGGLCAALAVGALAGVALPVTRWFADRNSPYPFSEKEMARFRVRDKMARLR